MFLIPGILGLIWFSLWMWQVSNVPETHRSISNTEREYIEHIIGKNLKNKNHRPMSLSSLPWKKMVRSKPVIGLFLTTLYVICLVSFFFRKQSG